MDEKIKKVLKDLPDEIVYIPDFFSLTGSAVISDNPHDYDWVYRLDEDDNNLITLMNKHIKNQNKANHYIANPQGAHDNYVPVYDLVLRKKKQLEIIDVNKEKRTVIKSNALLQYHDIIHEIAKRVKDKIEIQRLIIEHALLVKMIKEQGLGHNDFLKYNIEDGMYVELGCGDSKTPGYFGIDKYPYPCVDKIFDLENGIPLKNDSVIRLKAEHFIEHISDKIKIMNEIYRVCKDGAIVELTFPIAGSIGDFAHPDHKTHWNLETFYWWANDEFRKENNIYPKFEILSMKKINNNLHGYVKLLVIKSDENVLKVFQPPKPAMGFTRNEELKDIYDTWVKGRRVSVEFKYNGYRAILEKKGQKIEFYFEDTKRNLIKHYPDLLEEVKSIKEDVVLDLCLCAVDKDGKFLPRKDLAFFTSSKNIPLNFKTPNDIEGTLVAYVFDCVYLNEDIKKIKYSERRKKLADFFAKYDFHIFKLGEYKWVDNYKEFEKAVKDFRDRQGSEGVMIKLDTEYKLIPRTPDWTKIKNVASVNVEITDKFEVKGAKDVFNYEVRAKDSDVIGKTFNTKINAKKGDFLILLVEEVIPIIKNGKVINLSFVAPRVNKIAKNAMTIEQIIIEAKKNNVLQVNYKERPIVKIESNWSFKEGDSGTG